MSDGHNRGSKNPIILIGAGGIVRDAHLPAYRKAGYRVAGIYDRLGEKASAMARDFCLDTTFPSLESAIAAASPGTVFDLALPASEFYDVLRELPDGAAVLIQKPMGESLGAAKAIRELCEQKRLIAAINFQLRFAPAIAKARELINAGAIGQVHDMEVRVNVMTPWHLWKFMEGNPRVEINYHSIHYIDLIRSFLGDPERVYARTLKHPRAAHLAPTRSNILMDYGENIRAAISTNHGHAFGLKHQESYVKWEGTRGAIKTQLGLLMNYPQGTSDYLDVFSEESSAPQWKGEELQGSWFPDAFASSMGSLIDYVNGEATILPTAVQDAYKTMAVVEAAYQSSDSGGTHVAYN